MPFWRKENWPQIPHEEIVKRARILVIDDQEFPYQKLFKRDGYAMEKWNDVKDLSDLEAGNYDIILLDLLGVGRNESADEGLGVLRHIRTARPAQIVVAYSSADWPLDYQPFFDKADAVLPKTADYVDFKRTVDDLLEEKFSLGFYLTRIEQEADDHLGLVPAVRAKAERAILRGDTRLLERYLVKRLDDRATVDRILQLTQVAIGIMNIWNA